VDLSGSVGHENLQKEAPESGVLASAKAWEKLAKAWGIKGPAQVDFDKEILVVGTTGGSRLSVSAAARGARRGICPRIGGRQARSLLLAEGLPRRHVPGGLAPRPVQSPATWHLARQPLARRLPCQGEQPWSSLAQTRERIGPKSLAGPGHRDQHRRRFPARFTSDHAPAAPLSAPQAASARPGCCRSPETLVRCIAPSAAVRRVLGRGPGVVPFSSLPAKSSPNGSGVCSTPSRRHVVASSRRLHHNRSQSALAVRHLLSRVAPGKRRAESALNVHRRKGEGERGADRVGLCLEGVGRSGWEGGLLSPRRLLRGFATPRPRGAR
jgi:hypothetical protein